jgi:CRP-like cAMP-binding protein
MSAGMEDAMAIPYRSPFETTEDSHTVDAIQDASLLQFKAGETIDTIGHGSDYAYFIDEGHVQINYCADLPVSLDEVFQNAVYSVIQSHVSGNLEQADSISYSEHVANLAISQDSKSIWDYIEDRAASIFPGSVGSPGVASKRKLHARSDPRLQPIAQVLETAEEIVQNSVGGNVGNLLQSTRRKGQFVGAVSMLNPQFYGSKWFANMTAIDDVIVIRMSKSALDRFLVEHPMSQIHLRASMATTVSELLKLEALEKIAMARRKMLSQTSDDSIASAIGASLEEVAKHITESAAAGAEILSKLDVFALVGKLRENIDTNSTFKSVFTKKSTKNMKK